MICKSTASSALKEGRCDKLKFADDSRKRADGNSRRQTEVCRTFLRAPLATLFTLLALTGSTFGQTGQKPKPPEPDDVVRVFSELVQTDVMVFDKQGRFVNGLQREDFELRIDGKPRPVEFFERIAAGAPNEEAQLSAARGGTATNQKPNTARPVPLDRGRAIFFYLDDFHMSPGNLLQTRKLLLRFVEQTLGQNDMAAITSASGSVGFLQQLNDNKAVLRAAVDRLTPRSFGANDLQRPPINEYQALQIDRNDPDVVGYFVDALIAEEGIPRNLAEQVIRGRASQILRQAASVTTNTLAGLESLVRSSSKLPGRKLVIFISDGFFLDVNNSDTLYRLRKITSAAARNGVVIYSMDARGLVASLQDASSDVLPDPTGRLSRGASASGELFASQDGMNALAKDTGGRTIFDTNGLDVSLSNALKETSVYYLLAWRPDREVPENDRFRKIKVTLVGHPDLTVRVRQGFFDREPSVNDRNQPPTKVLDATQPAQSSATLGQSFRDLYPNTNLPVVANLGFLDIPSKGIMLTVSMQVTMNDITFASQGGKLKGEVDVRGTVYDDKGRPGGSFTDRLTVTAPSLEELQRTSKEVLYNYQVYLKPGLYQVRLGARDPATGKLGTAYEWIEIPDLSKRRLTIGSIITGERLLSPAADPNSSQTDVGFAAMRVDRRFHRDSMLRFIIYVYNAAKAPADGKPDLGVQVQVLRDQEPVITTSSKRIPTEGIESLDRLPYGGDLSLSGLVPGRYVLRIAIVDRIAKTSASQQLRFDIQ